MNLLNVLQVSPLDGGVLYAETDLNNIVAEPWNALSSLTFLIPVVYWFIKLKGQYRNYPFLVACMPLLVLGGIGSTIYHAFRTSYFFLLMDVVPIAFLTLMVGIYFWWKVTNKWSYVAIISIIFITLRFMVYNEIAFGRQQAINISYFITGIMIFVPAFLLLLKTDYHGVKTVMAATFLFILSLMFRQIDTPFFFLPMGTHWLWHVSCAAGAYFLGQYLYMIANLQEERVNA